MRKIKRLARHIKNFGSVYGIEIFFTNPFFHQAKVFGPFSFNLRDTKGYGFNIFIIGMNIKMVSYIGEEDI